jgi:hypothetical protein
MPFGFPPEYAFTFTGIPTQDILHLPIVFAALCVAALLLVIVAHYVGQVIFNGEGAVKR